MQKETLGKQTPTLLGLQLIATPPFPEVPTFSPSQVQLCYAVGRC